MKIKPGHIVKNLSPEEPARILDVKLLGSMYSVSFIGLSSKQSDEKIIYLEEMETREAERTSVDRTIEELELTKRITDTLAKAEILTVGDVLERMSAGEASMLAIDGFGRKSLADLKKRLRQFGYELPEAMDEIVV